MGLTPIVDRGKRDESRFCGYGKNPIIMGLTPMRQYNLPQCLYQWDYAMGLTPIAGRGKRDESRFWWKSNSHYRLLILWYKEQHAHRKIMGMWFEYPFLNPFFFLFNLYGDGITSCFQCGNIFA